MMRLYACGATDVLPDITVTEDELKTIIIRAAEQDTLELVLIATNRLSQDTGLRVSPELIAKCKTKLKWLLLESSTKRDFLITTIDSLEKNDINPLILKGEAISRLYALPEVRVSNDTDLLISPEDEKKAYTILEGLGYSVTPRTEFSNHATCTHKSVGILELHTTLYEEIISDIVFDGYDGAKLVSEAPMDFSISGHSFRTLGVTDHLIFLLLHMIQHFVKSGASVRQLMDIVLYMTRYRESADFERTESVMRSLGYIKIYSTVLYIGTCYFGVDAKLLPDCSEDGVPELAERFVSDIESGGWLGEKRERDGVCLRYLGARRSGSMDEFEHSMASYRTEKIKKAIFPDKRRIYRRFPFAAKSIILLPLGWICWLFYGAKIMTEGTLDTNAPKDFELAADTAVRVKLFGDLGMFRQNEEK